jgi:hypothetical protein
MKVELLSLCDFASAEPTGKMNLVGTFDRLFAKEAPIARSVFAVAARLRFDAFEEGARTVAISFVDSDGQRVMPLLRAQFNVRLQPNEPSATLNYVMVIPQIKLPRFGDYQIDLAVDDKVEASIPLYVRQRTAPPAPTVGGV